MSMPADAALRTDLTTFAMLCEVKPAKKQRLGLVAWLAVVYAAAAIGAFASINAREFYAQLNQPGWSPPGWIFGPVWTVLYGLMGIAAWLVWREGGFRVQRIPLGVFLAQLAINALWSWLFFGWHRGGLSVADIALLWVLIILTTVLFWRVRWIAGVLLLPYMGWVSFAGMLNYAMWELNPGRL